MSHSPRHRARSGPSPPPPSRRSPPLSRSHQIDQAQQRHPDDVERVPEEAEAKQAAAHVIERPPINGLRRQEDQPYEPDGDVDPMQAHEAEECRKEGAPRWTGAPREEPGKFAAL